MSKEFEEQVVQNLMRKIFGVVTKASPSSPAYCALQDIRMLASRSTAKAWRFRHWSRTRSLKCRKVMMSSCRSRSRTMPTIPFSVAKVCPALLCRSAWPWSSSTCSSTNCPTVPTVQ